MPLHKRTTWLWAGLLALSLLAAGAPAMAQKAKKGAARASSKGPITNSIGVKLVLIPAGSFTMGSNSSEASSDEKPMHRVTIRRPFYLGTTEVTQAQWKAVMGSNPSNFRGEDLPVEQVSWDDAREFCMKLSDKEGKEYRLPTEAEWEYACRGGSSGDRYADVDAVAWYEKNSGERTHPVGQKQPNAYGLYDMLGNVWEWCDDWYDNYPSASVADPTGPSWGSYRVNRGGGWFISADGCRSAYRSRRSPGARRLLGFRLLRTLP